MKMNYLANTQDTKQGEFEQIVSSPLTTRIGTSDPALGLFKAANQFMSKVALDNAIVMMALGHVYEADHC